MFAHKATCESGRYNGNASSTNLCKNLASFSTFCIIGNHPRKKATELWAKILYYCECKCDSLDGNMKEAL